MTGYHCPVDGCDYGESEEKEQASVTRHINAKAGEDHADVEALREQVADQGDDDPDDEGNDSPDDSPADTSPEDSGGDDEEDEDTMPSDEEYQQQYDQGDEEDDDQGDSTGGSGGSMLPALNQRTMMMLVGLALLLVLAYTLLNRDDSGTVDVEQEADDQGDDADEEVELFE